MILDTYFNHINSLIFNEERYGTNVEIIDELIILVNESTSSMIKMLEDVTNISFEKLRDILQVSISETICFESIDILTVKWLLSERLKNNKELIKALLVEY